MTHLKTSFVIVCLIVLSTACTKTNNDQVDPASTSSNNVGKPNGILYIDCVGEFMKLNTLDSAVLWTSATRNLFASFDNPMTLDSGMFYHGNISAITAYSSVTGMSRWSFSWGAFNDALAYREPAFKDSLLFVTSPTSMWDHANLYCLNKTTGKMKWERPIDAGYVSLPFNTRPMVMDDKVIVVTRDADNHKHLTAFKVVDAAQVWTTPINDSLSMSLNLVDGKIYSTSNQNAICYDATNGSLKWQTNFPLTAYNRTSTFFEKDRLIVVKLLGKDYTIFTVDLADGTVTKKGSLTIPANIQHENFEALACNYNKNNLIITTRHNLDTTSIKSYDLSNMSMRWEKRIANYYFASCKPVLTDKYLIVPINNTYPERKSNMYFLGLDGREVTRIPYQAIYTNTVVYVENGITYKFNGRYQSRGGGS